MKKDPRELHAARLSVSRRGAVAMVVAPLVAWPTIAITGMPMPAELPFEQFFRYSARLVFAGRIARIVFTEAPQAPEGSIFPLPPRDLQLYERHQVQRPGFGFMEIAEGRPLLAAPDVSEVELETLPKGTIYCYWDGLGRLPERDALMGQLVGRQVILFFRMRLTQLGAPGTPLPQPLFQPARAAHWRNNLPLPIEQLPTVRALAERLGYRSIANR